MRELRRRIAVFFFFVTVFAIFFYFWSPNLKRDFAGPDLWEIYHDSFYRSGLVKPFDFRLLTQSLGGNAYYLVLPTLVFNTLFYVFGWWAVPFWILGFLLCCANAVLLYHLVMILFRRRSIALLSVALFLGHAANLQTAFELTWIIDHPLVSFFSLHSMIWFVKFLESRRRFAYLISLLSFLLACLTKASGLTLIPTLMLLDFLLFRRELSGPRDWTVQNGLKWFDKFIPFLLFSFYFVFVMTYKYPTGAIAQRWGGVTASEFSLYRFLDFLTWLIFPFFVEGGKPVGLVILSVFLMAALLIWGNERVRFLAIWILISLSIFVISNFRELGSLYRYLYLGTMPFSILVSLGVFYSLAKFKALMSRLHVA